MIVPIQGGAFRLPNGNTIITETHHQNIIEVDNDIWKFNDLFKITNQIKDMKLTDDEIYVIDLALEKIK